MDRELKPCPFCGSGMWIKSNRDWHRLDGDHDDECFFDNQGACYEATDEGLASLVSDWNRRAPDPVTAELVEALEEARHELDEIALRDTGEAYNNPKINAAIAKAAGKE